MPAAHVVAETVELLLLLLLGCSILVVSVTDHFLWRDHNFRLLVASFGASAVLLYGVPESKLSQPRNLIGEQAASQPARQLERRAAAGSC